MILRTDPAASIRHKMAVLFCLAIFLIVLSACQSDPNTRVSYQGAVPPGALARLGKGTADVLAFSPDGQQVAVGGGIGLYLYDAVTLEELWLAASQTAVNSLAFSPDGAWLAAGLDDGSLTLIDATSGHVLQNAAMGSPVTSLAWSAERPDATSFLLAAGTNSGDVALSTVGGPAGQPTVALFGQLPRESAGVTAMAYGPSGRLLATADRTGTIYIWDNQSLEQIGTLSGHSQGNAVFALSWSSDGTDLLSGGRDGLVIVWDTDSLRARQVLTHHADTVLSVDYSADESHFTSISADGVAATWPSGSDQPTLNRDDLGQLRAAAWSLDRANLVTAAAAGSLSIWNGIENSIGNELQKTLVGHSEADQWASAVAWSPDGSWLASGSGNSILIWPGDLATQEPIEPDRILDGHSSLVTSLAWSPDSELLASSSRDMIVILWEAATGKKVRTLSGHTNSVTGLAWSPDGTQLATAGSLDGTIIIWDIASGEQLHTLQSLEPGQWSLAWSPDGRTLASGAHSGPVFLWDINQGPIREPVSILRGHFNWVADLAYSPDGQQLASASADSRVYVWDANSGDRLQILAVHSHVVRSLAFSPDGNRLISGSHDGLAIVWDLVSEDPERRILAGHTDKIDSVDWSPDGTKLATSSRDGTIIIWEDENVVQ